ncbi:replicative DNA helicase [Streptococcus phage Javan374]|jgi:replicative DNA helicase|uniref:replicative DNA helicase n=1 Tax=Streptococcus parasanguinis TaxID=1318 RepID=UPI00066D6E10|nr:replicative DNA helicase [Streptococcus parasanguinis]QBX27239.1 replicative DNA helicase [Streptococcus phage Javan374]
MAENMNVLPHDLLAEQAVLGSIFLDPDKIHIASEYLTKDSFFKLSHGMVFNIMQELSDKGDPIDPVSVKSALDSIGQFEQIGGMPFLASLINAVPTSAHIEHYSKVVAEKSRARKVIEDLSHSISSVYDGQKDLNEILSQTEQNLSTISNEQKKGFRPIIDVIDSTQSILDERSQKVGDVTGTSTGFTDFDQITTGLHEDNLIIIAARPAMGKTAFALNIAQNVAKNSDKAVAIFSLEMGAESLVERMLSAEGLIPSYHVRTGNLTESEWRRMISAQERLARGKIFIDDTAGVKISEIRSKAKRLAQENDGLGLIVIDYLQLIEGRGRENRQQEVSEISRQLKILAKELKVPVIALSQLSRGVDQRNDKRPILSDLRESGSIEQDADIVAFLYREAYYKRDEQEEPDNVTELILEKNRHGSLGTVQLFFLKEYAKFSNKEA